MCLNRQQVVYCILHVHVVLVQLHNNARMVDALERVRSTVGGATNHHLLGTTVSFLPPTPPTPPRAPKPRHLPAEGSVVTETLYLPSLPPGGAVPGNDGAPRVVTPVARGLLRACSTSRSTRLHNNLYYRFGRRLRSDAGRLSICCDSPKSQSRSVLQPLSHFRCTFSSASSFQSSVIVYGRRKFGQGGL